jgi:hypothetical protein
MLWRFLEKRTRELEEKLNVTENKVAQLVANKDLEANAEKKHQVGTSEKRHRCKMGRTL